MFYVFLYKRGRLALERVSGAHGAAYKTVQEAQATEDILQVVFEDGRLVREYSFEEVRKNAAI